MEHHSMSDKDFHARYGVTPREVEDALDENRRRVARRLSEWGYAWAVDEIMCDVAVELLKGGLRRWASYEERKPLGAFVNTLIGNRLGEWMRTEWTGNGVLDRFLEDESLFGEFLRTPVSEGGVESLVVEPPHIVVEVGA